MTAKERMRMGNSIYLNEDEKKKVDKLKKKIHAPTDKALFFAIAKAIADSTSMDDLKKGILLEFDN